MLSVVDVEYVDLVSVVVHRVDRSTFMGVSGAAPH
jgi:hypothetical protein